MLRSSMIAALLLGTGSAPPATAPPASPAKPAAMRAPSTFTSEAVPTRSGDSTAAPDSLALSRDAAQRMTVMVNVAEQGPFAFLVDTGSERNSISRQLATQVGLRVGVPVRVHSVLGTGMVETVHIPRLGVGKQALSVIDAPTFEAEHIGASGILDLSGVEVQHLTVAFASARIFKGLGYGDKPAILLGIDAMRSFDKVSIDCAQKKARFVLPAVAMTNEYQSAAR